MSGRSSPVNGAYEAARLTVRKDLFPDIRVPKLNSDSSEDDLDNVSCINLATDFEQSIDAIANQKQLSNGSLTSPVRSRHRKHKHRSRRDTERSINNGCLPPESKRKKSSRHKKHSSKSKVTHVKGGKNLNLVSSSECRDEEDNEEEEQEEHIVENVVAEESESSDDEVLKCSVKLPRINGPRQSGKPYSHELSQLSTKKSKKDSSKERRTRAVIPCSGKPRSMLGICSSRSKKKSKKAESTTTYRSQIVDVNTIKIKIRRTGVHETVAPAPISIADIGQRKSKKKRAASPVASVSSGEEYNPSCGDTAAAMSVAAPKPRNTRVSKPKPSKTKKNNNNKSKGKNKSEKTERNRIRGAQSDAAGPQSPWGYSMPEEILTKIFEYVVSSQGSLPAVIRLSRVCKLWHSVSCKPELWRNVDLTLYTPEKYKTDYKLVWLLENRLSKCENLNIAQWKVSNVSWVLACVADYCPALVELSVAGWSRITPEQLFDLLQGLPQLQRIDLSLTSETGGSSTCLSAASMARVAENFGERLTHLNLASNKFTALPQILSSVATYCKNLEVLDISGAQAMSHPAAVPLEAMQKGCPMLRVFRAANSQLVLATATTSQQMEASGWSQLEELSIASEAATERATLGEYRLGDDALARLVRGATRLRLLDLRGLQRLSDSGLVRVPAWELQHLFLGGSNVLRKSDACLELVCEKWAHSLQELDLSWATAARVLHDALAALSEAPHSRLRILNLCGSSVMLESVKKVLLRCSQLESINLSSCRALPRGMKRVFVGAELHALKASLDPTKPKPTDDEPQQSASTKNTDTDFKSEATVYESPARDTAKVESKTPSKSQSVFQQPKSVSEFVPKHTPPMDALTKSSPDSKTVERPGRNRPVAEGRRSTRGTTPKLLSPMTPSRPDSSSTPRSEHVKIELGSPHFSPVSKPDSQVQNSPEIQFESIKSNSSWSLGQFKTTPTHKSEASPLSRLDSQKIKHGKIMEQCSPTTSLDNKTSPETFIVKQEIKNPWNYGNYSPMPRQDSQFSSQRSPYSAQPSPAQPSPYSTQPSPYSTQPSPYSSQPSPYSAQPSPDTSQMVKPDMQKSGAWNPGSYSPMPKNPFSPHTATHASPDPGVGIKSDTLRNNSNKTPGQYSPMSRQDRMHHSPYSPRPSVDNSAYSNKKSPGVGNYSPMLRADCLVTSDAGPPPPRTGRAPDMFGRAVPKAPELMHTSVPAPDFANSWGIDKFNQMCNAPASSIESLIWGTSSFTPELPPAAVDSAPELLSTPPPQWAGLPPFEGASRDPWTLGQFRVEPPHQMHNTFVEQNVSFESLSSSHAPHQPHFLDEGYTESSHVD